MQVINTIKKAANQVYLKLNGLNSRNLVFKANHKFVRPIVKRYFTSIYRYEGIKLYLNPSRYIDALLIRGEEHDKEVLDLIHKNIRSREDVFVDIGANFGMFSLVAGKVGTVYAFEPSMRENLRFYRNIDLNKDKVVIYAFPVAIGKSRNGTGKLFLGAESNTGTNSMVVDNGYGFVEVNFMELESVLSSEIIDRIRLIKIDVEGYEPEVIEAIIPVLQKIDHCILIVEVNKDRAKEVESMYNLLASVGYTWEKGVTCASSQYNEVFVK